VRKNKVRVPIV